MNTNYDYCNYNLNIWGYEVPFIPFSLTVSSQFGLICRRSTFCLLVCTHFNSTNGGGSEVWEWVGISLWLLESPFIKLKCFTHCIVVCTCNNSKEWVDQSCLFRRRGWELNYPLRCFSYRKRSSLKSALLCCIQGCRAEGVSAFVLFFG